MPGGTCSRCGLTIEGQSVTLAKLDYHPECFVCHKCRKSLKGKACHIHEGNVFDPECFESHVAAKCDICFAPIVGDNVKFLKCGNKTYHVDCYVCHSCKKSLQGIQYLTAENNTRVCVPCSEKK